MSIKKGSITIASSVPTTEWGSIEGTLSDQTDIQNALNSKASTLSPSFTGIPTVPTASQGTNTNQIASTKFVKTEINESLENIDVLPDQTGHSGKFLTTNGTDASWGNIPAELPSQTGQAGKVLTTNGTTVSWTEYQSAPATDNETIHLNSSDELEVIGTIEKNAGDVKYDWIGTYAEWEAGRENQTIPDDWVCYITDDFVPSTVTHNIGDIFYSLRTDTMFNGAVACDGTQYDIANYSSGTQSLKSLLDAGKLPYVSIADFDATVTANGSCRCFGYDGSSATVFKVPKLNDVFIEAGVAANNSEFIEAGLPNITGIAGTEVSGCIAAYKNAQSKTSGAITMTNLNQYGVNNTGSGTEIQQYKLDFDASDSNSIYGNSNTVQPNAVKYRAFIQLANATSESALQTVSSVVNDVNDLKDEIEETLQYKNITNCITEIPQDIKLELNDGTLTLKAGSKAYIPDGFEDDGTTTKFDEVIIENDTNLSVVWGTSGSVLIYLTPDKRLTQIGLITERVSSGSTAPTATNKQLWYDTTNNIIKQYGNGSVDLVGCSFPLALCTKTDSTESTLINSIDQVFNGFGYIGSTVFALPGVKGLIPNGRNEDGTLNNVLVSLTEVKTLTEVVSNVPKTYITMNANGTLGGLAFTANGKIRKYDEEKNLIWNESIQKYISLVLLGTYTIEENSKITNFNPKTPFHALDYNDKSTISGWSMPSSKYVDLAVSASGTQYIAPANGWIYILTNSSTNETGWLSVNVLNYSDGLDISRTGLGRAFIPVRKNETVTITYGGTTINIARFIYAQGEI